MNKNFLQTWWRCGLIFWIIPCFSAVGQTPSGVPGKSRFLEQNRVEVIEGNLPLIISAPHGGRLTPKEIPDRTSGTLVTDTHTDRLAADIAEAFHAQTGKYPYVIICHLKRTKVDCNRAIEEGAQGNPDAEKVWQAFQSSIEAARRQVSSSFGQGVYVDLHGHGHPEPHLEIGYLLTNRQLKLDSAALAALEDQTSLREAAAGPENDFLELLRGPESFGAFMQKRGYSSIPSPDHPHAGEAHFFSGGYNTRQHAWKDKDGIVGFQLETPGPGVRSTPAERKAFAAAFAEAMREYMSHFRPAKEEIHAR